MGKVQREVRGWRGFMPMPDGKSVWLLTDHGEKIAKWDLASGASTNRFDPPGYPFCTANNGQAIVTIDIEGRVTAGTQTGKQRFAWSAIEANCFALARRDLRINTCSFCLARRPFFAAIVDRQPSTGDNNESQSLYFCEITTGKIVWQIKAVWEGGSCSAISSTVTFSPDGKTLAIGHWKVKLLDASTGKERPNLRATGR